MPRMKQATLLQFLFICLVWTAASLAYLPGLSGGFALDDYTNIVDNSALQVSSLSWSELSRAAFSFQAGPTMRPISMLSFAINAYMSGVDDAGPFKLVNLCIHLLNGLLVLLLLLQLLRAYRARLAPETSESRLEWLALIAGAIWLLHPLNLMPVLYVVQRETTLSTFFVLAGVNTYLYARGRGLDGRGGAWLLWTVVPVLTLLAIVSKESGALLPVYLLMVELFIFRFRRPGGGTDRLMLLYYGLGLVLPVCAGIVWAIKGQVINYANRDFTLSERLMSEARIVWLYIRWTLWPDLSSLGLYHDDIAISHGLFAPASTLFSVIGIAALLAGCFMLRRRLPLVALGIAWFLGGQLMESTVFPLELAYEHRCYLPDLGLILAVASLICPLTEGARFPLPRYGLLAVALCACGLLTWQRAADWKDNLTFASNEAHHHPGSVYATYMLGQIYANKALFDDPGQYPNAVQALEAASVVPKSGIIPDVSLVLVEAQIKKYVDPAVLERIAVKLGGPHISASDIQGLNALVDCKDRKNCDLPDPGMQKIFDSALNNPQIGKLVGPHANVLVIYGNYLAAQDPSPENIAKARSEMVKAVQLVPTEPQYRANLVTMDIDLRDVELATQDLDTLRKLNYLGHLDSQIAEFELEIKNLRERTQR